MKLPLLTFLAFLPCAALAQSDSGPASTPPANPPAATEHHHHHHHFRPEKQFARLTTKLGLNDTQQGQIKPLLFAKADKLKTIHHDTSLTKEQKHEQVKALVESTNQQIEAFLTPTQVETFKQLHHHHA